MRARLDSQTSFVVRLAILGIIAMTLTSQVVAQAQIAQVQPEQAPERFWIAGRYDGNRIIVYFDAVKFEGTLASIAEKLPAPVARGFFHPVKVPWTYSARFQKGPEIEHFALGDKYDLLLDSGLVRTATLTTLVGAETDEEVGNDSFLGALATLDKENAMVLDKNYYVLRRHRENESSADKENHPLKPHATYAYMENEPVRFGIQTEIVDLLTQRMKAMATVPQRSAVEGTSPVVEVRAFHLPDGSLRYYASAEWYSSNRITDANSCAVGAWLAPQPTLHILALEPRTFGYESDEPTLLNVLDLGGGRAGMIVSIASGESIETGLFEYRDGTDLKHMRLLQSIAAGE